MSRHDFEGGANSRAKRQNTKITRGIPNVVNTRRLEELLNPKPEQEDTMSVMDAVRKWTGTARDAVKNLSSAGQEITREHAEVGQKKNHLLSALAPKRDVLAAMDAAIDANAAKERSKLGPLLVAALGGRIDVRPTGEVQGVQQGDLWGFGALPGQLSFRDLAALAPELVKAGLRAAIEATDYPAGPPLPDRPKLIAELDARIADLEWQHAELVDAAAEAGVTIPHLEANRIRRLQAAQAEERRLCQERDSRPRGDRG